MWCFMVTKLLRLYQLCNNCVFLWSNCTLWVSLYERSGLPLWCKEHVGRQAAWLKAGFHHLITRKADLTFKIHSALMLNDWFNKCGTTVTKSLTETLTICVSVSQSASLAHICHPWTSLRDQVWPSQQTNKQKTSESARNSKWDKHPNVPFEESLCSV